MKVLEIISLGYVAGGAENYVVKTNHYLTHKGYCIKTLASDLGTDKKHFNEYAFKNINFRYPLKLLFSLFNPSSFFVLRRILKEYQPDVIHLHTMHQITPSALLLLKKYPTVLTLHGPESFLSQLLVWCLKPSNFRRTLYDKKDLNVMGKLTYLYFNHVQKLLYKRAFKNVDVFIAPSRYIQTVARADVAPVVYVPNFIELREFQALKNSYNLLFVGRLEKFKGVEYLIRGVSAIIQVFPQTTLTIIGDGPDKTDLTNLTEELHLEKHVQFRGWVENKDLDAFYQRTSIVVVPSTVAEAFGIVILEAMSAGRPVIGTNVGGIPEIIDDGVNGYLVEPNNPEQIAEKVIQLFSDESVLRDLGRNARKKVEEFSIEKHVGSLERIYEEIVNKYKPQSLSNQLIS